MATAILHLSLAFLTFLGVIIAYVIWSRGGFGDKPIKNIFYFFIFFTFYNLFLSLPFFLYNQNARIMAQGYNLAIAFMFLTCVPMWRMHLKVFWNFPRQIINVMMVFFLIIGSAVVFSQFLDLHLPLIDESGFMVWKPNFVTGVITSISIGILPFFFGISLSKDYPKAITFKERLKLILLSAGSFSYTAACVYFIAQNIFMVISAFILVSLGTILWLIAFSIPSKKSSLA